MEVIESRASIFGRLTDRFSREILTKQLFDVEVSNLPKSLKSPKYKDDGYFVFLDIPPSTDDYELLIRGKLYAPRIVKQNLAINSTTELNYPGEDELYVYITGITAGQKKVSFKKHSFIPTIKKGSTVIGESGFVSELNEDLEGSDKDFATLIDVAGLSQHTILRFLRSKSLTLNPGPYYIFPKDTTVLSLLIKESGSNVIPVNEVSLEITKINDKPILITDVDGLEVKSVQLNGSPSDRLVLGTSNDINRIADKKGVALFYFDNNTPITKLHIKLKKNGYQEVTHQVAIVHGVRQFNELTITPL